MVSSWALDCLKIGEINLFFHPTLYLRQGDDFLVVDTYNDQSRMKIKYVILEVFVSDAENDT
jgi:hypothetical protein